MAKIEATLQKLANQFTNDLMINSVRTSFGSVEDLGRCVDGRAYIDARECVIRRNPISCDRAFCLAHEIAHVWQADNGKPFCEREADSIASELVGYSHFDLKENRI